MLSWLLHTLINYLCSHGPSRFADIASLCDSAITVGLWSLKPLRARPMILVSTSTLEAEYADICFSIQMNYEVIRKFAYYFSHLPGTYQIMLIQVGISRKIPSKEICMVAISSEPYQLYIKERLNNISDVVCNFLFSQFVLYNNTLGNFDSPARNVFIRRNFSTFRNQI